MSNRPIGKRPKHGELDPLLVATLDATGLDWWVAYGKKHNKVLLASRLALVFSMGNSKRDFQRGLTPKMVRNVRRLAQAIREGKT